jgi:biotin synthase
MSKQERFDLAINMVAVLRLMMPYINISAVTALQAIDPEGREKALYAGANIIMPNITPVRFRKEYNLYENKPFTDADAAGTLLALDRRIRNAGFEIGYGEWGDSKHFAQRKSILQ